jgi:DNA-binding response OmpR family regulator
MQNCKILLVEDDPNLAYLLRVHFERERFMVDTVNTGADALAHLKAHTYELIVLDWMLPDIAGVEVCEQFRSSGGQTPVLILTARGTVDDKAQGFEAGADDYVVKPFHPKELSARVKALLRRPRTLESRVLQIRDIEFNTNTRLVMRGGMNIELTPKESALLELLMRYPDRSFSLEAILDRLWRSDTSASIDTVRTHMKTLRKKIGDTEENPVFRTKRGVGYSLVS